MPEDRDTDPTAAPAAQPDDGGRGPEPPAGAPSALLIGGTPASRERLTRAKVALTHDEGDAGRVAAVLVSTRVHRGQGAVATRRLRAATDAPILALVHPGGEAEAVAIQQAGGNGALAEGGESSVLAYLDSGTAPDSAATVRFHEAYESHAALDIPGGRRVSSVDAVTQLPTGRQLDERLAALSTSGDPVRLAYLRVAGWDLCERRLATDAAGLLRRRLAVRFDDVLSRHGAELYALSGGDLAAVGVGWSPTAAGLACQALGGIVATFAPSGHERLGLHVGHVGPELTTDVNALRELAARALRLATRQESSAVVGPDELVRTLAPTTEIEAALRMVDHVERDDPDGPGHARRVAMLVSDLSQRLRSTAAERGMARLAAHLHDIGKTRLEPDTRFDGDLDDDGRAAYRTHPELGAAYLRVPAGEEVAAAVRGHHERWDGAGFPDGLAGNGIPLAARIIAVADAVDRARCRGRSDALISQELRDDADVRLDRTVVDVAVELLEQRPDERPPAHAGQA